MKTVFFMLGIATVLNVHAANTQALKYIPGGEIVQEKAKEVKVKTPQGTIVEIEFNRDGTFEEASGKNIEKDAFVPEDGLISLSEAISTLKKEGKAPAGDWELEKSFIRGWHYKFEGYEKNQKYDYVVDAKTGKLLESKLDD